jgi:hypothetical protein
MWIRKMAFLILSFKNGRDLNSLGEFLQKIVSCHNLERTSKQHQTPIKLHRKETIMTILSKLDNIAADKYGRYVTFVDTKSKGPQTPVRRSLRKRKGTPRPLAKSAESNDLSDFLHELNEEKNNAPVFDDKDIDELCTIFQTTLVVDNHSLAVADVKTKILSPEPKYGRCVTVKENKANAITPVKRSTRNIEDE